MMIRPPPPLAPPQPARCRPPTVSPRPTHLPVVVWDSPGEPQGSSGGSAQPVTPPAASAAPESAPLPIQQDPDSSIDRLASPNRPEVDHSVPDPLRRRKRVSITAFTAGTPATSLCPHHSSISDPAPNPVGVVPL